MTNTNSPGSNLQKQITLNGINGSTGAYFTPPFTVQSLLDNVILQQEQQKAPKKGKTYRLAPEFGDGSSLENSGWGLIFPADAESRVISQIEEALSPLLELRKSQTKYFKIFKGANGYQWKGGQGESFFDFVRRHYAGIGPADPTKIPYYLMLVGDPNSIPFSFQFSLNAQYAVGRIYFNRLDEYNNYARSVVAAETGKVSLARKAVFFGPSHPGDEATNQSSSGLIAPLMDYANQISVAQKLGWQASLVPPEQATKKKLDELLGGKASETPALLFTATHGLEWSYGDPRQEQFQGALVCQDYPGPSAWNGELKRDFYMAGEDIASSQDRSLLGMIAIHFACFGGGTPYWDDFTIAYEQDRKALARKAFLARLPMNLLSHPKGGALAVISHVERAWTYSFQWDDGGQQTQAMRSLLYQLMAGKPIGLAFENLDERYTTIAGDLLPKIEELKYEPSKYDPFDMATNWIMAKDARGYSVLGDPAVRLPLTENEGAGSTTTLVIDAYPQDKLPDVLVLKSLPEAEQTASKNEPKSEPEAGNENISAPKQGAKMTIESPSPEQAVDTPNEKSAVESLHPPVQSIKPPVQSITTPSQQPTSQQANTLLGALVEMNQVYGSQRAVPFGIKEDVEAALKNVVTALTSTFTSLTTNLQKFASDITSLDVETYTARDLANPEINKNVSEISKIGQRVAWTHINLDGDIQVVVPIEDGKVNETLWQVHKDMVDLAQANRTEMIKAVTEALTRLITPIK